MMVTTKIITLNDDNSTEYSLEIQNTGDIPLINANFTIANESNIVVYQSDLISLGNLMTNNTKTLTRTINYAVFQNGSTFHTVVQVKFAESQASANRGRYLAAIFSAPSTNADACPHAFSNSNVTSARASFRWFT